MDGDPSFMQVLKQRRKALDLTQQELARRVGCAVVTIQRLEQGTLRPSQQVVERLANILELPLDEREPFVHLARNRPTSNAVASPDNVVIAPSSRLPAPLTPLIGRAAEVAAVCEALAAPGVRVLTLTGPGGIGKTRLALQVAAALQGVFTDGVIFVDLAPIVDHALIAASIAQRVGVDAGGGQPLLVALTHYLQDKHLLLVLDNFEHLVAAAPLVAELLAAAPRLTVLMTSRVVVGIYGEYVVAVPPLHVPNLDLPPLPELRQVEAVQLFLARAAAASRGFVLTPDNGALVAELCHALEGLPLAIELAAARLRHLPLETIRARMGSRLMLLTGGARTLLPRQQTLRATLAWSYDLLDSGEQCLVRRLAVFAGGWTLEAAETVCDVAGDLPFAMLDGLASLVDKSLVRQEHPASAGGNGALTGEARYTMLETVREYAREQLGVQGEAEVLAMQQRHAAYFVALAELAAPEVIGAQGQHWLTRLAADYPNLQAALAWSFSRPSQVERGLRLAAALQWFWIIRNQWGEAHLWLGRAVPLSRQGRTAPMVHANVVRAAGIMAVFRTAYAEGDVLLEESQSLAQRAGSRPAVAEALMFRGWIARERGNYPRAAALTTEALRLYQAEAHSWGSCTALLFLTEVFLDSGDLAQATAYGERLLTLSRESEQLVVHLRALLRLGRIAYLRGEHEQAQAWLAACLAGFQATQAPSAVAEAQFELGRVARARGKLEEAKQWVQASLRMYWQVWGNKREMAYGLEELAALAAARYQPTRAARLLGAAAALRESIGIPLPPVHQPENAQVVAATQVQLERNTYEAAMAEGRAMTLEQAIAYALESIEEDSDHLHPG